MQDTVNTASRMESNGLPGRIQVSQQTAYHLISAGKGSWLTPRADVIEAKGKGKMITYWVFLKPGNTNGSSLELHSLVNEKRISDVNMKRAEEDEDENEPTASHTDEVDDQSCDVLDIENNTEPLSHQTLRLIDWLGSCFSGYLQRVVATGFDIGQTELLNNTMECTIPLDEYCETIVMPKGSVLSTENFDTDLIKLMGNGEVELRSFIGRIARAYQNNPFHNFERACQVVKSVNRLLQSHESVENTSSIIQYLDDDNELSYESHFFSFTGSKIQLDPIAQFALLFAALIHNVDHTGHTNQQLIQQDSPLGIQYRNRCVTEQNSFTVAWKIFMHQDFRDLRKCLFRTENNMQYFRQLVINLVLETDLFDTEMKIVRRIRWDKAYGKNEFGSEPNSYDLYNQKCTIFLQHIIQAADIMHTMQSWRMYHGWNKRLFEETYESYCQVGSGTIEADPYDTWYLDELNFFDEYVVPLATELEQMNLLGRIANDLLEHAKCNRHEWEMKGQEILREHASQVNTNLWHHSYLTIWSHSSTN
jgi:3'5'-cyclic nucleotide phosphodiesterase/Adenylate and Guanylate cyclase catalytic domain